MTVTVIEAQDNALLDAYRASDEFVSNFSDATVTVGATAGAEDGYVHWLLIEDDAEEDNATFRLTESGIKFHAGGVEV